GRDVLARRPEGHHARQPRPLPRDRGLTGWPPTRQGTAPAAPTAMPVARRAALLQERSRHTRRELVRAALALWNERGFERGVEETTVEEIARAAGVTKGTFYF